MGDTKNINKNLASILSTPLRIVQDKALPILTAYLGFTEAACSGNCEKQIQDNIEANRVKVFEIKANEALDFENFKVESSLKMKASDTPFKDAPQGSVIVVPVMGVMMRESSYSWRYGYIQGTRELEDIVRAADASPNISAIVFKAKTPGGEAAGNESLARTIKSCSTPTLMSFEGLASAGLEAFIGVDENYALEKDSYYGSLGTMTTVINDSKYWANMGVDFIEVLAPQSTLKNIETRSAREGDSKPMEDLLEKSTDFFIKDVKKARPQIIDDGKIFKGQIYNAVEALKIKAIDGIKDFDYVLKRAAFLGRKNKRNNKSKEMKTAEELAEEKLAAEKTADTVTISKEDKNVLDKMKGFFASFGKHADGDVEEITPIQKATAEIDTLKGSIVNQQKTIDELTADREALQTRVSDFEADTANLKDAKVLEGEKPFETVEAMVKVYNEAFAHNLELGGPGKAANLPVPDKEELDVNASNVADKELTVSQREAQIEKKMADRKKAREAKETEKK